MGKGAVGDCIVSRVEITNANPYGRIRIEQADPIVRIAAEWIDNDLELHPDVTISGDLLKIYGTNQTVIYRIGEKDPDSLTYFAEWPD